MWVLKAPQRPGRHRCVPMGAARLLRVRARARQFSCQTLAALGCAGRSHAPVHGSLPGTRGPNAWLRAHALRCAVGPQIAILWEVAPCNKRAPALGILAFCVSTMSFPLLHECTTTHAVPLRTVSSARVPLSAASPTPRPLHRRRLPRPQCSYRILPHNLAPGVQPPKAMLGCAAAAFRPCPCQRV